MIPAGKHIRPHYLILIKDIGQTPGQLKSLKVAVFSGKIGNERLILLPDYIAQQAVQPPGKNLSLKAVGAYSQSQLIGDKA